MAKAAKREAVQPLLDAAAEPLDLVCTEVSKTIEEVRISVGGGVYKSVMRDIYTYKLAEADQALDIHPFTQVTIRSTTPLSFTEADEYTMTMSDIWEVPPEAT